MRVVLQRVSEASVKVDGELIGRIGAGLLVLLCAEKGDTDEVADKMLAKILKLRIFGDDSGKMNLSVQDVFGGLLIVSQFTLAADVSSGTRPGFSAAAAPEEGRRLYDYFVDRAKLLHPVVQTGRFAADMKVALVNDGPVTIPISLRASGV
jgi:D-tyrosyl-tRNA(Tyr) deacylase